MGRFELEKAVECPAWCPACAQLRRPVSCGEQCPRILSPLWRLVGAPRMDLARSGGSGNALFGIQGTWALSLGCVTFPS